MTEELYITTLLHEMVHLRQWVRGQLKFKSGRMTWGEIRVATLEYDSQPHEIEAFGMERPLYLEYMWDKTGNDYGDS